MARSIQVILLSSVAGLGQSEEVVTVRQGFARNFLLPKNLAVRASNKFLNELKEKHLRTMEENLMEEKKANEISSSMKNVSIIIYKASSQSGRLYGSVRSSDIFKELLKITPGISNLHVKIILSQSIKIVGSYLIRVILHKDIFSHILVKVLSQDKNDENTTP